MDKKQLAILNLSNYATNKEVAQLFKSVIDAIDKLKATLNEKVESRGTKLTDEYRNAETRLTEALGQLATTRREMGVVGGTVEKMRGELAAEIATVRQAIPAALDLAYLEDAITALQDALKSIPPQLLGEDIRNALEALQGDERLDKSAIKGLDEEIKRIEGKITSGGGTGTIAIQRGQIMLYDLSDQLNGVLKTFSLPAFWRVTDVSSTSDPKAFRPTVDYTTDGGAFTITFTSQVDAASTLAAGQSIIIQYASL